MRITAFISKEQIFCVAVVPDGMPVVTFDKTGLEHGGPLIADCHSPPSYPATNLTWYVNEQKVSYC